MDYNTEKVVSNDGFTDLILELEQNDNREITHAKLSLGMNGQVFTMSATQCLREFDKWLEQNPSYCYSHDLEIETQKGFITIEEAEKEKAFLESKSKKIKESHIGMLKNLID